MTRIFKGTGCNKTSSVSIASKEEPAQLKCPVCTGNSVYHRDLVNWGEMRCCLVCGLIFANPLQLPQDPKQFFEEAYQGQISEAKMEEFSKRVLDWQRMERMNLSLPLGNSKTKALKWIKEHFPPGSCILDIGCGLGSFLDALRNAGFKPIGLETSILVVEELRRKGHTVWHGTVDDIQGELPEISVCTCFYVLHHIIDPLGFFQSIRRRFPNSWLLLVDGAYWRHPYPKPPRHFTMWTAHSLSFALHKAGYDAEVSELHYSGDFGLPVSMFLPLLEVNRRFMLLYRLYRRIKFLLLWPMVLWRLLYGKPLVLFACARPASEENNLLLEK